MTKKRTVLPAGTSNPSKYIGGNPAEHYHTVCTPEEMIDAVKRAHGIARDAAKILDCTRRTVMSYVNRFPEVKQAYNEAREENVDVAENSQLQALNKGERWAIENWLFCSKEGRARGWLKRAEQGQDLNLLNAIQIIIPDNARDAAATAVVAAEATVDVTQIGDDGDVRLYTYATTLEEARRQKQLSHLVPGRTESGYAPPDNDSEWLNVDSVQDDGGGTA